VQKVGIEFYIDNKLLYFITNGQFINSVSSISALRRFLSLYVLQRAEAFNLWNIPFLC